MHGYLKEAYEEKLGEYGTQVVFTVEVVVKVEDLKEHAFEEGIDKIRECGSFEVREVELLRQDDRRRL